MSNTERSERYPPMGAPVEGVSKVEMSEVMFRSESVAKCVASYFTNTEVIEGGCGFFVKSFLLNRETVLRILHKHHLPTDEFFVDTYWA